MPDTWGAGLSARSPISKPRRAMKRAFPLQLAGIAARRALGPTGLGVGRGSGVRFEQGTFSTPSAYMVVGVRPAEVLT